MKVVCTHCGLPFSVARAEPARPVFCCSGCALAFRLASPSANSAAAAPVSAPAPVLLAALGSAFLFFNQALAALLAGLAAESEVFVFASLAAGALAWSALLILRRHTGVARGSDRVVALAALVLLVLGAVKLRPGLALLGNSLLLAWSVRGLVWRKVPRKK